jgi:hypothetical protein
VTRNTDHLHREKQGTSISLLLSRKALGLPSIDVAAVADSEDDNVIGFQIKYYSVVSNPKSK